MRLKLLHAMLEVRLNAILNYLSDLSFAQLVLHIAFALLAVVVVIFLWPSSNKGEQAATTPTPAPAKKSKNKFERKEPGWDGAKPVVKQANVVTPSTSAEPKPGLFSRLFRSKKVPEQTEIIGSQKADYGFKHPNVTDHFSELVKPGPVSDLKAPDVDELDQIFSTMLKAGAISGKPHLVTNFEHQYLEKLRIWFSYRCYIYCQVSVGSVININTDVSNLNLQQRLKFAQKCQNMSFDFLLVEKSTEKIVCAIELDDPTHLRADRISRDRRLDKLCVAANIPIFHITNIYHKPDLRRMLSKPAA